MNVEQVKAICDDIGNNKATIANYNSYKQFVISLTTDIYGYFTAKIKYLGGHIIPLKVNRPFPHPMMRPAADNYYVELQKYEFATPGYPIYINVTGEKFIEDNSIQEKLYEQIFMPV